MTGTQKPWGVERRDVEQVLLNLLGQEETERLALRARLRHLTSLGFLRLPQVGSGKRITYNREHIFWMALALQLELLGQSPKRVVEILREIQSEYTPPMVENGRRYLLIYPTRTEIVHQDAVQPLLSELVAVSLINLSEIAAKLGRQIVTLTHPVLVLNDKPNTSADLSIQQCIFEARDGIKFD